MPSGVGYLVANEGAERFSYYGMRAILVVFMTGMLMNAEGELDLMGEAEAKAAYHWFASAVYFFPFLGALLADAVWGKYRTIILLSVVYCVGHVALAFDHTRVGLAVGLSLIAMGSGGIKPCVSANLGDQFTSLNAHLLPRAFSWFYFAINLGAFGSMLLTPWLLEHYGPNWAFGVPGLLMFAATGIFLVEDGNMYIFLRLAGVCFENFKIRDRGVPFSSFVVSMGLSLFFGRYTIKRPLRGYYRPSIWIVNGWE